MNVPRRPLALLAIWLAATGTLAGADSLDDLVARGLAENRQLKSLEAAIEALDQKARWVGAWTDPRLMLALQNVPWDQPTLGQEPMSQLALRAEQKVPWFGKLRDRARVIELASESKRHQLEEARNQLRALIRRAYYQLGLTRHLRAITGDHIRLVDELIDAVRARYEAGRAEQQHLIRLEVTREKLTDDLGDYDQRQRQLTAVLNATLRRPVDERIETPDQFELPAATTTTEALFEQARQARPLLAQLAAMAQKYEAAAALERREAIPDPTIFLSYGVRTDLPSGNPSDLVTFGVALPLPLFYRSRTLPKAAEQDARARAERFKRENALDEITGALDRELAAWKRAYDRQHAYQQRILPGAQQVLEATLSAYRVGRADFVSLFDAELDLLTYEKTLRMTTVEGLLARTNIESLIGRDLP